MITLRNRKRINNRNICSSSVFSTSYPDLWFIINQSMISLLTNEKEKGLGRGRRKVPLIFAFLLLLSSSFYPFKSIHLFSFTLSFSILSLFF